jgi:hypothetical protein
MHAWFKFFGIQDHRLAARRTLNPAIRSGGRRMRRRPRRKKTVAATGRSPSADTTGEHRMQTDSRFLLATREKESFEVMEQRKIRAELFRRAQAGLPISVFDADHPRSQRRFHCVVKPGATKSDDWTIDILSSTAWLVPDDLAYVALFFPKHLVIVMHCEGIADLEALRSNDQDAFEALTGYRKDPPAPAI